MANSTRSQTHELGLRLAEEGRHEEALEQIREHLRRFPKDPQALNDGGVILFCMGSNEEAIDHLERAKACCAASEAGEINWNLCETYLGAGYPGAAMKLFDEMERQEILSPDILNRGANAFLMQDMYGHAIELLIRSFEMAPSQEILKPMIEVIRSRRPRVGVFARDENESTQGVFEFLGQRFPATLHTGMGQPEMRSWLEQCDIAYFDGCWDTLIEASLIPTACRFVISLSDQDVYEDALQNICWRNVDTVILTSNPVARERLPERLGELDKHVNVVTTCRGVDTKRFGFTDRARGKRIACLDELTLKHNPMLLLQCMQKLQYIDRDYRLYFAGEFGDASTENYIRYMVEELEISNAVFFDTAGRNEASWLRDKHHIVTAAVTADGSAGVLKGMSCGLKPVVHTFPGARQVFGDEFLFKISEDFCRQILSDVYEPRRYRQFVEDRYSQGRQFRAIHDVMYRLEKDLARKGLAAARSAEPLPDVPHSSTRPGPSGGPTVFGGAPEGQMSSPATIGGSPLAEVESSFMPNGAQLSDEAESPQIPWSAESEAGQPQTAARHLCDRVSSINQMSADILANWKTFAAIQNGAGGEYTASGQDPGPAEAAASGTDFEAAGGGLRITELGPREGAVAAEVKRIPFVRPAQTVFPAG